MLEIIKRQKEADLAESLIEKKGRDWTMSRSAVEVINEFTGSMIVTGSKKGGKVQMCRAFEVLEERGEKRGIEKGIDRHLVTLIIKKLGKGKPVDVIADEVEEEEGYVSGICAIAAEYAPDYNVDAILKKIDKMKNRAVS